ncbi:MAG: VWA domain-containing protein [Elusimicrobia bacterium]|nr:VWA domain-containing protein [Elusimicrobiota bacterium]
MLRLLSGFLLVPVLAGFLRAEGLWEKEAGEVFEAAQQVPLPPFDPNYRMRVQSDLVYIPISVFDSKNFRPIPGLSSGHFKIEDEGEKILQFDLASEEVPISVGILVDVSGSMPNYSAAAWKGVHALLKNLKPQDRFFVTLFNRRQREVPEKYLNLGQPREQSIINTSLQLGFVDEDKAHTNLCEAVYFGLSRLQADQSGGYAKRALILASDAYDNPEGAVYDCEDVKNFIKDSEVQIYLVGYPADIGRPIRDLQDMNWAWREVWYWGDQMVKQTGGLTLQASDPQEVEEKVVGILDILRRQYVAYYPLPEGACESGKDEREIKVDLELSKEDKKRLKESGYQKAKIQFREQYRVFCPSSP